MARRRFGRLQSCPGYSILNGAHRVAGQLKGQRPGQLRLRRLSPAGSYGGGEGLELSTSRMGGIALSQSTFGDAG
jgi:hypothetical protein